MSKMMQPEVEKKLMEWVKNNPETEDTISKRLHNKRWLYLTSVIISGMFLYVAYLTIKFQHEERKITTYIEEKGKRGKKTGRILIKEHYE